MAAGPLTRANISAFARRLVDSAVEFRGTALIERRFRVADLTISLCCCDPVIAAAYASRLGTSETEATDNEVDHSFFVFHAAELGWPSVPLWTDERCAPRQFHDILLAHKLQVSYPHSPGVWQVYDQVARVSVQLTNSRADLPPWDFGAPLRQHLHWLLPQHRLRLTHAAAVGRNGRGVLLVGDGGSGKSETTLAAIASGLVTCGDDYVATGVNGGPIAGLLYRILKQDPAGLNRFSDLRGAIGGLPINWQGKIELDPESTFPGCLTNWLKIEAAVVPFITRRKTAEIAPISRGELMRALMRSNLYQYPGEPDDGLAFFAKFLVQIPCYRIELALDPHRNSDAIARLLEQLLQ
jgi:hypothetical protein